MHLNFHCKIYSQPNLPIYIYLQMWNFYYFILMVEKIQIWVEKLSVVASAGWNHNLQINEFFTLTLTLQVYLICIAY